MQSIREVFRENELSEDATEILIKSRGQCASKQYSSHILHWCNFCSCQKANPFNASINEVAEFLTQPSLHSEFEYSVINSARYVLMC